MVVLSTPSCLGSPTMMYPTLPSLLYVYIGALTKYFSLHDVILKCWNSFLIQPTLLVGLKETIKMFDEFMTTSYGCQRQSVYVVISMETSKTIVCLTLHFQNVTLAIHVVCSSYDISQGCHIYQ